MTEYRLYLESLVPQGENLNKRFMENFTKEAKYIGGGWYGWGAFMSRDIRVLFLKGCLSRLNVKFKDEE